MTILIVRYIDAYNTLVILTNSLPRESLDVSPVDESRLSDLRSCIGGFIVQKPDHTWLRSLLLFFSPRSLSQGLLYVESGSYLP